MEGKERVEVVEDGELCEDLLETVVEGFLGEFDLAHVAEAAKGFAC